MGYRPGGHKELDMTERLNAHTSQWGTTSHLLGYLLSKSQETTIASKDMEKRKPLCTIGENVTCKLV